MSIQFIQSSNSGFLSPQAVSRSFNAFLADNSQPERYETLGIPATSMKEPSSNAPTLGVIGSTNIETWQYPAGSDKHLYFSVHLPRTWYEGSVITPVVCYLPSNTNTDTLSWRIEYIIQKPSGTFATSGTVINKNVAPSGTALKYEKAIFDDIATSELKIDTIMSGRLTRLGSSDSFTGNAILLNLLLRIKKDTSRGSQKKDEKWSD